jgi:hypothetical protein
MGCHRCRSSRKAHYDKSADGWVAWPPARLFHGVPRLDGVVPQHPPLGHRHRRARWLPAVGRQGDPFGMSGRHVVPEANDLLLLIVHQPTLAASLGGTVLVAGAFFEHPENPTETPTCPAGEIAVTRLTKVSATLTA